MTQPIRGGPRAGGLILVALLMILFGAAEVVTGFRHQFFGISTPAVTIFTIAAATIGGFYVVGGLLILMMRKRAAALAIALLGADVVGRVALVLAGLYPLDSPLQVVSILLGTAIAAAFAFFVAWTWGFFPRRTGLKEGPPSGAHQCRRPGGGANDRA